MSLSAPLDALRSLKASLLKRILEFPDLRPGSLVGRYRRCGRPACHCAREQSAAHGPSWSLTRTVKGKTVTRIIMAEAVEATCRQIADYHCFQQLIHELVETNTAICNGLLHGETGQESEPQEDEEKPLHDSQPGDRRRASG